MADENDKKDLKTSGQNSSPQKPKKSINVTKPQESGPKLSNIDASRVSAHTLREQQSLERLKKKIGTLEHKESNVSKIKTIVAIILIVILIIILVILLFLLKGNDVEDVKDDTSIRVSMEIENKSVLSVISNEGIEQLRPIYPGDRLPISAYARNANNYQGDVDTGDIIGTNQYVRFKIRLILDYEDRYEIIVPTMSSNWYKYNEEHESNINNGIKEDDHYYYYCGSVPYQRRIELFSELEFDGNKIFIEDAGKYGQIQVLVESIDANTDNLLNGIWPTAPKRWILDMVAGRYNNSSSAETGNS